MIDRLRNILGRVSLVEWLVLLSLVQSIAYLYGGMVKYNYDVPSYLDAAATLASGQVDVVRTPLYPLLILAGLKLCPAHWEILPVVVQYGVYLVSIYLLRDISRRLIPSRRLAWLPVVFYVIYPYFIKVNLTPVTESLAMSSTVIWIWLLIRYVDRPTLSRALGIGLLLAAMLMLRPATLAVVAATAGVALLMIAARSSRRCGAQLLAAMLIPAATFTSYSAVVAKQLGYHSPTVVSVVNDYHAARLATMTYPDLLTDRPEMLDMMRRFDGIRSADYADDTAIYDELRIVQTHPSMGIIAMRDYTQGIARHHTADWLRLQLTKLRHSCSLRQYPLNVPTYLIIIAFTALTIVDLRRRRAWHPVAVALLLMAWTSVLSVIVGAQSDWMRLLMPALPAVALMGCMLIDRLITHKSPLTPPCHA